jgi:hypothetical protein
MEDRKCDTCIHFRPFDVFYEDEEEDSENGFCSQSGCNDKIVNKDDYCEEYF